MAEREPAWPAAGSPAFRPEGPAASPAQSPGGDVFRARLRRETHAAHERLDASFGALGDGDPESYARFLQVNEACLRRLEPLLAAALETLPPGRWRFEPRHAEAAADLAVLRFPPLALDAFSVARPTVAQAIGIAYVLEGSRLGGRLILRALHRRIGDAARSIPTSFLESADPVDHFKPFLAAAEELLPDAPEQDEAIGAANATFEYFLTAALAVRAEENSGVI